MTALQQLNYTTSPSQAFVGSFYGPIYSPGVAEPSCSVLISPGLGTTVGAGCYHVAFPSLIQYVKVIIIIIIISMPSRRHEP